MSQTFLQNKRVAVVDDDAVFLGIVENWLTEAGYSCSTFTGGADFLQRFKSDRFDVVLLDWMMPRTNGRTVLEQLRARKDRNVPVLFVTVRNAEEDISFMLDAGADDYLCKPVRKRELVARLGALLRRAEPQTDEPPFTIGELTVFTSTRKVLRAGVEIDMTERERDLALFVLRQPGALLSRQDLLEKVWGRAPHVETRTIDAFMARLRRSLGLTGEAGLTLKAVRGVGYKLSVEGLTGK
jgi:two-component system, OmpR family, response regulator RegX3